MQSPDGLSHTIPPVDTLGKVCIIVIAGHRYKKRVIVLGKYLGEMWAKALDAFSQI